MDVVTMAPEETEGFDLKNKLFIRNALSDREWLI
jgi:hypothetical protein